MQITELDSYFNAKIQIAFNAFLSIELCLREILSSMTEIIIQLPVPEFQSFLL